MKPLVDTINKGRIHKYNILTNSKLIVDNDSDLTENNDAINNINNNTDNSSDTSTN